MSVNRTVLIAHAEGEETIAEQIGRPLCAAGYEVSHAGTVLVGDSVIEEAARLLVTGAPVVLCGTVKSLGTGWAHRLVNAARSYPGVRVFPLQIEKEAYIQQLALDAKVGLFWRDPSGAIADLLASLRRHFPADPTSQIDAIELRTHLNNYLRTQIEYYDAQPWRPRAIPLHIVESECSGRVPAEPCPPSKHFECTASCHLQ